MENLFDKENPNASPEYKAVVRRLAQLVVESVDDGFPDNDEELLEFALEATLDAKVDLDAAVHDLVRRNFPFKNQATWVSDLCWDFHTAAENGTEADTAWLSAATHLSEL